METYFLTSIFASDSSPTALVITLLTIGFLSITKWTHTLSRPFLRLFASSGFLGKFPNQIYHITNLLLSAKRDITVVTDAPAYGCISKPKAYSRYLEALEIQAQAGLDITYITYTPSRLKALAAKEFDPDFSKPIESKKLRKKIEKYQKVFPGEPVLTYGDLFREALIRCRELLEKLQAHPNCRILLTDQEIQMLYFSADNFSKSIVAFYFFDKLNMEVTFETHDSLMLSIMKEYVGKAQNSENGTFWELGQQPYKLPKERKISQHRTPGEMLLL